ncbi:lipopolysaccharide kinase InaA family protein [Dokdonia sp. Hel_I_53]|uniref:lipopolysaccharide kinase InaA family protein n=1 Tax=Dokdonia sp. Hel_I_53 TaxID=1566287 RepID=UPI00119C7764|nr:lipopolysaccharide kinase InaA family protein [Dokdonia sp. Hel_I_53]TVZ51778.1 lipopolysaccharide kinase (Kdo/WaaP) family protein [Dokdonia sp. Hel_I_53]
MKTVFSKTFAGDKTAIEKCIINFDTSGKKFDERKRNSLKLFDLGNVTINVKSFKVPNLVNRVAYKSFRDSKARRSFEYAHILLERGVLTPQPIAYFEEEGLLFGKSYYVSNHLSYDLTYRDLCKESPYLGNEKILKAFTAFTYELHQKEINFLDHSLGNTLIVIKDEGYDFYLVDLNRMKFGPMDFKARMRNFARLSPREEDIIIMAREYAVLSGHSFDEVFEAMFQEIADFQEAFYKKKLVKKRLKFWKK